MFARSAAKRRIEFLSTGATFSKNVSAKKISTNEKSFLSANEQSLRTTEDSRVARESWVGKLIDQADLNLSPFFFLMLVAISGSIFLVVASRIVSIYVLPLFFVLGALVPFRWLRSRAAKRAEEFSSDYPSVVLATAASMKAGMSVFTALERSVQLFPDNSLVRKEVLALLERMRRGERPEVAVRKFGNRIPQPEVALFRTAFVLAIENGGKFAPTLERLATVTRDRSLLIQSARVSTTTMRMTANALLVLAPIILAMIAVRTEGFWEILLNNPVSNTLGSIGVVVILASYLVLQRMSGFKP